MGKHKVTIYRMVHVYKNIKKHIREKTNEIFYENRFVYNGKHIIDK